MDMVFVAGCGFSCPFCNHNVSFDRVRYSQDGHIYLTGTCASCGRLVLVGLTETVQAVMNAAKKRQN